MKASDIAIELIKNDKTEKPVFVTLFTRDGDGNVLTKNKYPVEAVFSHRDSEASIYIEQSQLIDA